MLNQRKQAERRSLEAAQLSLLGKTIETQGERIKALESFIAIFSAEVALIPWMHRSADLNILLVDADEILPKTEEVK